MKATSFLAITAIIFSTVAIWFNIDWDKIYKDCDKKKQDCYKACKEVKDAARNEVNHERVRIDSLIEFATQDTNSTWMQVESLRAQRDGLPTNELTSL